MLVPFATKSRPKKWTEFEKIFGLKKTLRNTRIIPGMQEDTHVIALLYVGKTPAVIKNNAVYRAPILSGDVASRIIRPPIVTRMGRATWNVLSRVLSA